VAFVTGEVVVARKINKDFIREVFNNGMECVFKGSELLMEMPCKITCKLKMNHILPHSLKPAAEYNVKYMCPTRQ